MEYTVSAADLSNIRLNETDEVKEILRNVAVVLATPKGSVPLYREFGLDTRFLDKPVNTAKNAAVIPVREAIEQWEPRAVYKGYVAFPGPGKSRKAVFYRANRNQTRLTVAPRLRRGANKQRMAGDTS